MKIQKYFWTLNIIGAIIILISILTPTSYNDGALSFYYVWMIQLAVVVSPLNISLIRPDITLIMVSVILTLIIFSCGVIAITLTSTYIRTSLDFKKLRWKMLLMAGLVVAATLYWIIMMESYYNSYGYNHWIASGGEYSPYFGVIGPFIGAALIGFGAFTKRG